MERSYNFINATTQDLRQAEQMARELVNKLVEIQWVMTPEEQRGIYSLMFHLDWEACADGSVVSAEDRVQSQKLRDILKSIQ